MASRQAESSSVCWVVVRKDRPSAYVVVWAQLWDEARREGALELGVDLPEVECDREGRRVA